MLALEKQNLSTVGHCIPRLDKCKYLQTVCAIQPIAGILRKNVEHSYQLETSALKVMYV